MRPNKPRIHRLKAQFIHNHFTLSTNTNNQNNMFTLMLICKKCGWQAISPDSIHDSLTEAEYKICFRHIASTEHTLAMLANEIEG